MNTKRVVISPATKYLYLYSKLIQVIGRKCTHIHSKLFDVHHWEGLRIDIMPNDWKLGMNMERSMIPLQCLYSIEETFVILTKMQYNLPILQVNQTWRVFSRPVVNTFYPWVTILF